MEKLTEEQRNRMDMLLEKADIIDLIQNLLEENGVTDIFVKSISLRSKILNPANIVVFNADANVAYSPCKSGYQLKTVCDGSSCRKKCVKIPT